MAIIKIGPKFQVTIPKEARDDIGLRVGDFVEVTVRKDQIVLRPKIVVDRHPEIDAAICEGLEDIKAGRVHGPFNSVKDFLRDRHSRTKTRGRKKAKKTR